MKKAILLILMMMLFVKQYGYSEELFDVKLGIFSIQDTKGEKTYTGFPELSISISKYVKENITVGLELDYYQLPRNYNLWGNMIGSEIQVFKNFINFGWRKEQKNGFMGLSLGYDMGYDLIGGLIRGQKLGRTDTLQLIFSKGIRPKNWKENILVVIDAGVQNKPGLKIFVHCGIGFEYNLMCRRGNK